jgi:hypothetical protein
LRNTFKSKTDLKLMPAHLVSTYLVWFIYRYAINLINLWNKYNILVG